MTKNIELLPQDLLDLLFLPKIIGMMLANINTQGTNNENITKTEIKERQTMVPYRPILSGAFFGSKSLETEKMILTL